MILGLANAIEPSPFFLTAGASYLRDWVNETLTLVPPLDVSILTTPSQSHAPMDLMVNSGSEVTALEPTVSDVRVERAAAPLAQEPVMNPRMEVICGIAKTLYNEGSSWTNAFKKAYELWEKLNPQVMTALAMNAPQGIVPVGDVAQSNENPAPPPVEDLEDDSAVPLEVGDVDR